jgi:hypothetical protein
MAASEDELRLRVLNAQERLDTELKRWLDPQTDEGKCVIAKACMALRNNDGGFLIIGLHDNGLPDNDDVPQNIRVLFAPDRIQEIVSRFASDRFEIYVHFVQRDGVDRVVIEIQGGVRTPVVCRSDLRPPGSAAGLRADTVYVRTLESNGRVSTAPMRYGDWSRLLNTCFTNREADIGSFIRRHLPSSVDPVTCLALQTRYWPRGNPLRLKLRISLLTPVTSAMLHNAPTIRPHRRTSAQGRLRW